MDDLFSNALRQLLLGHSSSPIVRSIEAGSDGLLLWQAIDDSGFADALVPLAQEGAGLGLSQVFELFSLCGEFALPLPLAETMLARGLLAQAQSPIPRGSITLASGKLDAQGTLVCDRVMGGRVAHWVLVELVSTDSHPILLETRQAQQTTAVFPLDATLRWSAAQVALAQRIDCQKGVRSLQACIYAAQISGALGQVFQRTLQYANDRQQFGRSIGKFQAIQHQLSVMSEHCFAARAAAQIGCQAAGLQPDRLRVAVAKARTSEAALEVAALSHSIHGAVGFTEELDLQLFTRRLHHWRQAAGSESYWQQVLGTALVEQRSEPCLDLIRQVTDFDCKENTE